VQVKNTHTRGQTTILII